MKLHQSKYKKNYRAYILDHIKDLPRLVGWVISCLCEPIEREEATL